MSELLPIEKIIANSNADSAARVQEFVQYHHALNRFAGDLYLEAFGHQPVTENTAAKNDYNQFRRSLAELVTLGNLSVNSPDALPKHLQRWTDLVPLAETEEWRTEVQEDVGNSHHKMYQVFPNLAGKTIIARFKESYYVGPVNFSNGSLPYF